jgi:hypothetical protein
MFGVRRPEVPTEVTVGAFGGPTCAVPLAAREVDKRRQHTSEPPVENSGQCPGFVEQQVALVEVAVGKDITQDCSISSRPNLPAPLVYPVCQADHSGVFDQPLDPTA